MYAHDYGGAFYHTATRAMIGKKSSVGTYISPALRGGLKSLELSDRSWVSLILCPWELSGVIVTCG